MVVKESLFISNKLAYLCFVACSSFLYHIYLCLTLVFKKSLQNALDSKVCYVYIVCSSFYQTLSCKCESIYRTEL